MSIGKTVEYGAVFVTTADASSSVVKDSSPINVLSNGGQVVTGIASLTGPAGTIATAPAALTLTTGKIITDAKNGDAISSGDILSVTGNTVAIIGAVGVALGAPVAIPALAIGTAINMLGVAINQGWFEKAFDAWREEVNRDGKYHVYDPLVLDLDGDGIETVGTQGYKGALFDHNSDGIRTATGWISSDDGLLVIDRNGDGIINDGTELFGDSYTLSDGTKAEHGYAALAEFDSNGDGKVDAQDTNFDKLRVWRDLNQDGISQEGELFTLSEVGVQSLNVAYQDVNTRLGNGNTIAQKGSYTTADGETREMGDLLLAADHLHSRYADSIELTEGQIQAANVQGIGRLRDLREAAALSPELAKTLAAYSNAETKAAQQALLDQLVGEWAKTDPRYGGNIQFAAPFIKTASEGRALPPSQERELLNKVYIPSKEYQEMAAQTLHKIAALDAFSGEKSNIIYVSSDNDVLKFFTVANKAYDTLSQNLYQALLFQTRLQPYLNEIGLKIENDEFVLDYSGVAAKFGEVRTFFQTFLQFFKKIRPLADTIRPSENMFRRPFFLVIMKKVMQETLCKSHKFTICLA